MSLSKIAPRRFGLRSGPAYPTLVALALTTACNGSTARPAPDQAVQVPAATASAVPATTDSPPSTAGAGEPPRFAADDQVLDMNVGCKGDCPSPYQMAAGSKDRAQIQARVEHCARARAVDKATASLRGKVGADGRATQLAFENEDGALGDPMRNCILDLASKALFTPPEKGRSERILYARFQFPPPR